MKAVTVEGLKKAGVKNAEAVYDQIALAGGFGTYDGSYRPALDLTGLSGEAKTEVEKVIADSKTAKTPKTDA